MALPTPLQAAADCVSCRGDSPVERAQPGVMWPRRLGGAGWFTGQLTRWFAGLVTALLLSACTGGGITSLSCDVPTTNGAAVGGTALYEDKTYGNRGFIGRVLKPVRFATVELRRVPSDVVIGIASTDGAGNYCVEQTVFTPGNVKVRVVAAARVPGGQVSVDDGRSSTSYFMESNRPFTLTEAAVTTASTLVAFEDSPWSPRGFGLTKLGGAFNLLDNAVNAIGFVHDLWGGPDLPRLQVKWISSGDGQGTFFLRRQQGNSVNFIHMKGRVAGDSDEYDDDIFLHEFGHFVLSVRSQDNSRGGSHFINGTTQDARLSWSEGWANFFSAMVRDVRPGGFSNRSGIRASIIDSFALTEGSQGALRFSFELATPQAFTPDQSDPVLGGVAVTARLFKALVKGSTSEVSVGTALWDIYAGGPTWPALGVDGMRRVIANIPNQASATEQVTFETFWRSLRQLEPALAAAVRSHLVADRQMSLDEDLLGLDDTVAELNALTGADQIDHNFPPNGGLPSVGHTLTTSRRVDSAGQLADVDLFRLTVNPGATYVITTENLIDGADTFLEVLTDDAAQTVIDSNDNYIPFPVRFVVNDNGTQVPDFATQLVHTDCNVAPANSLRGVITGLRNPTAVRNCPPNAQNPRPAPLASTPEYLASQVTVQLATGSYLIRVSRSVAAPPSADHAGGYDLRVTLQ